MGVVAADDGVDFLPRVGREGDDGAEEVPLREAPLGHRDPEVGRRRFEQVLAVLGVEDGEVGPVAEELGVAAEEPGADRVERPGRHPRQVGAEEALDPPGHLLRRPVREREEEERLRGDAVLDEARNAVDEGPGLPRPGPRHDDGRAVRGEDDGLLFGVQLPVVVDPVALRRGGPPKDVAFRGGGRELGRHESGVSRGRSRTAAPAPGSPVSGSVTS